MGRARLCVINKLQYSNRVDWERAPHARACHPPGGEEHLLPLLVVAGAAYDDESGKKLWTEPDFFGRVTMSSLGFSV